MWMFSRGGKLRWHWVPTGTWARKSMIWENMHDVFITQPGQKVRSKVHLRVYSKI